MVGEIQKQGPIAYFGAELEGMKTHFDDLKTGLLEEAKIAMIQQLALAVGAKLAPLIIPGGGATLLKPSQSVKLRCIKLSSRSRIP
jgi:hypothetical protein